MSVAGQSRRFRDVGCESALPREPTSSVRPAMSEKCRKRTHAPQYRLVVLRIEFAGMDRSSLQSSPALRFAARSFRRPPLDVDGCQEPFNLAVIADQPQTRTRRTRQPWPSQKRCVTHSQLPNSSYGPGPAP